MFQKVLVPLDGSDLAECALPHVIRMAKEGFVKNVCILTVIDIHPSALLEGADTTAIYKAQTANSQEYLGKMRARFQAAGIEVTTEILQGPAAQLISEYAKEKQVELIVIATHGYSGVKRLMFGSVAFRVLHDSHVPVLLIRPDSCQV